MKSNKTLTMSGNCYRQLSGDSYGFCLACGADAYYCEPDAEKYYCSSCGQKKVYGIEQLLIMGRVEITEEM